MGLVLAFQTSPRPASRSTERRRAGTPRSADILFFTGVRYERHGDPVAVRAASLATASAGLEQPAS